MSDTDTEAAPKLIALDMDRTLINISLIVSKLVEVCHQVGGIDTEALKAMRQQAEAEGGSFDVLGELWNMGTSIQKILRVQGRFADNVEADNFLYDDGNRLLTAIDEARTPHIIPTYGSEDWQLAKLYASGLAARPYLVTPMKYKGELIASWHDVDKYSVQANGGQLLVARTVDLADDKADAFRGLPADCWGAHLVRLDEIQVASQKGSLPPNAEVVHSLDELLPRIQEVAA